MCLSKIEALLAIDKLGKVANSKRKFNREVNLKKVHSLDPALLFPKPTKDEEKRKRDQEFAKMAFGEDYEKIQQIVASNATHSLFSWIF